MQKITTTDGLQVSALIAGLWEKIMYDFGYKDYCSAKSSFTDIGYAYTQDAPPSCKERGELLWKTLLESLGDESNGMKMRIGLWDMKLVSRRQDLRDK